MCSLKWRFSEPTTLGAGRDIIDSLGMIGSAGRTMFIREFLFSDAESLAEWATDYARRGIGAEIYARLGARERGVAAIHTEASRISRPFFAKHGYALVEVEHVVRFGVEFERFRMRKVLG